MPSDPASRVSAVDLLQAAFQQRDRQQLEALAAAGVALEVRDVSGRTVLMRIAEAGDVETLEWILAAGADPDRRLDDGRTALMLATAKGHRAVVAALLAAGAEAQPRNDATDEATRRAAHGDRPKPAVHPTSPGPVGPPPRLAELRGLGDWHSDDESLLVAAPPGPVAGALTRLLGATVWQRQAYGQDIVTTPRCYLVFRFRGQRWSIVRPAWERQPALSDLEADTQGQELTTLAQRLSHHLLAATILVDYQPSRGIFRYYLFDRGRAREHLHSRVAVPGVWPSTRSDGDGSKAPGTSPTQPGHQEQRPDRQPDDPPRSIHHLLCRHHAYAPSWGRLRGEHHRLEIAGLSADDFERLDFVALP